MKVQQPAIPTLRKPRALGDPTRHTIFRYVADAGTPVDVAELTKHFALNHNTIRQHLAKLVDANLVIEEQAPSTGRGRPRLKYRPIPPQTAVGAPPDHTSVSACSSAKCSAPATQRLKSGVAPADVSSSAPPPKKILSRRRRGDGTLRLRPDGS